MKEYSLITDRDRVCVCGEQKVVEKFILDLKPQPYLGMEAVIGRCYFSNLGPEDIKSLGHSC